MNSPRRLTKYREDHTEGVVDSRQFHVVNEFEGRNSFEDELTAVGVFSFVSLKRHVRNPQPHNRQKDENGDYRE